MIETPPSATAESVLELLRLDPPAGKRYKYVISNALHSGNLRAPGAAPIVHFTAVTTSKLIEGTGTAVWKWASGMHLLFNFFQTVRR